MKLMAPKEHFSDKSQEQKLIDSEWGTYVSYATAFLKFL